MNLVAIIGGTGLDNYSPNPTPEYRIVQTRYGEAQYVELESHSGEKVLFLPRHGPDHRHVPHRINYRANMMALAEMGVTAVYATNAVGSLRPELQPGDMVVLDDFIDMTRRWPSTIFEDEEVAPEHVHSDFSVPYCPVLRDCLIHAARARGCPTRPQGTYLCTDGPRYETPAEVKMFGKLGADVVGMTGVPEVVFARELGLCYAGLAIVTNLGAGLKPTPVAHSNVKKVMVARMPLIMAVLMDAADSTPTDRSCQCGVGKTK